MSVIIANFEEASGEKKERLVEIYKNEVYKDVDLLTYKHVEGNAVPSPEAKNAISSDTAEDMDGAVIVRYVEFRDAILRRKMQSVLAPREQGYADDDLNLDDHKYRYRLVLPVEFNDNLLEPLAEYIHRFLVWGALYDWYSQFGMPQASVYGAQLDGLEEDISGILRAPSIAKRPMQPFGPAGKRVLL